MNNKEKRIKSKFISASIQRLDNGISKEVESKLDSTLYKLLIETIEKMDVPKNEEELARLKKFNSFTEAMDSSLHN